MDGLRESSSFLQVWCRCFVPEQVRVWGVGETACDGRVEPSAEDEVSLEGPVLCNELTITRISIRSDQPSGIGVGACNQQSWNVHYVGSQTSGDEFFDEFRGCD